MTQLQAMVQAMAEVENELIAAIKKHGMPVDYHHGIGILGEEVHELFLEVFRKDAEIERLTMELADMTRQRDEHAHNMRCAVDEVERSKRHARSCAESMLKAHEEEREVRKHLGAVMKRESELRRKIGEWADRMTQKHGMTGGMVDQMREEAEK